MRCVCNTEFIVDVSSNAPFARRSQQNKIIKQNTIKFNQILITRGGKLISGGKNLVIA